MANQVKSPKSIDTRSQRSIADNTVGNTWRLSHPYLITLSVMGLLLVYDSMQVVCSPWRPHYFIVNSVDISYTSDLPPSS